MIHHEEGHRSGCYMPQSRCDSGTKYLVTTCCLISVFLTTLGALIIIIILKIIAKRRASISQTSNYTTSEGTNDNDFDMTFERCSENGTLDKSIC